MVALEREFTKALDTLPPNLYVKGPQLVLYGIFQEHNVHSLISKGLFEEIEVMEMLF
jgi:hypothetical protein